MAKTFSKTPSEVNCKILRFLVAEMKSFDPLNVQPQHVGPTPSRQIKLLCDPSAGIEEVDQNYEAASRLQCRKYPFIGFTQTAWALVMPGFCFNDLGNLGFIVR